MDHARIDEDLWADRYLLDRLSADERQRFEEHFVDCPKCLEDLEAIRGLRQGLREIPLPQAATSLRVPAWLPVAASLLVGIGLASLIFHGEVGRARRDLADSRASLDRLERSEAELRKERDRARGAAAPSAAEVFTLEVTRGAQTSESENRIVTDKSSSQLVLQFDRPPGPAEASYVVRISTSDGRPVGEPLTLAPVGDTLALSIPGLLLQPGGYVLAVEPPLGAADIPLATYRFQVVARP